MCASEASILEDVYYHVRGLIVINICLFATILNLMFIVGDSGALW